MGGMLSRLAPMELRGQDRVQTETYNMLLETDTFLHSQRALRREMCIIRSILILILLLCSTFCLLYFILQIPTCRDRERSFKPNGDTSSWAGPQVAAHEEKPRLHSASLSVDCSSHLLSERGNMTWKERHEGSGFTLDKDRKSLVVPKDGLYRISLQVTYRGTTEVLCKEQFILNHFLSIYSEGYPRPRATLDAYETIFCKEPDWKKTLYSEDVINLQQGDKLIVESSNLNLIDCQGKVTIKTFLTAREEPTG